MLNSPSIPPSPTSTPEPRSEVDETDLRPVDEIRADLGAIAQGVGIRGRLSETEAAHRLLADVGPLLDRLAAAERELDDQMHAAVTWMARARAAEAHLAAVQTAIDETESFKRDGYPWTHENNIKAHIRAALAAPSPQAATKEWRPTMSCCRSASEHELHRPSPQAEPAKRPVPDLMEALRASVDAARQEREAQAEPATCPHGKTEAHRRRYFDSTTLRVVTVGCPGPQSTEPQR